MNVFDRHLDNLRQRLEALRDRAGGWPEDCRQEMEAALRECSQAIAALPTAAEAGLTRQEKIPRGQEAQAGGASGDLTAATPAGSSGPGAAGRPPEESRERCEAILSNIFSAIPDLLTVIDRDHNIVMSNWYRPEVPEEMRRDQPKCYRVYHRRDRPCEDCHVLKVFATGQPQKVEKLYDIDGRALEFSAFPILNESGQVILVAEHVRDIQERYLAEKALKESEEHFRAIFEAAQDAIFIKDRSFRYTQVNPAMERLFDRPAADLIGRSDWELVGAEAAAQIREIDQRVLSGEVVKEVNTVPIQGVFTTFHVVIVPLYDDAGEVAGLCGIARDITDLKRTEMALRESEERFRAIFDHAPVGIGMVDLTGRLLQTNRALQELLGYTAEELIGIEALELIYPEDRPESARLGMELLAGNLRHYSLEKRHRRKDGSIVWGQVTSILVRDVLGAPEYFIGTVIDITARKQAEAELRQSEKRFRLMAETIQDVFWMDTPEIGKTLYVSPGYEQIWGRTCEELYRNPRFFIESIHPEDRERVRSEISAGHRQGIPWSHEYRIVKPDGAVRWIHDRGFPVRDDQGRVIMFTGVATDITERKALEQQLLQAQKMEAVGRLAGGVAHDFNNLLMTIMGYGELMKNKVLPGDPLYGYLKDILTAAERATALTRQLLAFSRRQIVHPQVIEVNRVVLDLEQMLRRLIGEDIELEIITDSGLGAVKADPGHLGQIIMNLAVNARDAMPRGGHLTLKTAPVDFDENRSTRFGPVPPGAYVMLVLRDTGVGMDEATQAHIFEPFFTTKEPGKGTGLGLSTVYGIVKQSEGFIDVASEPGAGSTFTIYLPRLEAITEPPKTKIPLTASFRGEETILLVEDEDVLRALLAKFLRLCGYTVLEARHGGEALSLCTRHQGPIHMLVTDVVMPQMSGRELADRLTSLRPDIKVLYMSGYAEDSMVQYGVTDLSVPFLQKPFKPIDLARRIYAVFHPPA